VGGATGLLLAAAIALSLFANASAESQGSLAGAAHVSAGGAHNCAIAADGGLACWGDDSAGQLDGIPEGEFRAVSAGGAHTCAIRSDGELACWGDDSAGQLDGIPEGEFRAVSAGGAHTCAIRTDGRLACWGDDSAGQLDSVPWGEFVSVSAGGTRTCAIRTSGHLSCWGPHHNHPYGIPPYGYHRWDEFLAVSVGGDHACAIREDGGLTCWGEDSAGQLDGVPGGEFRAVSAGGSHTCAIKADGGLACWGDDSAGQLDGVPEGRFLSVSAGGNHTCAIRADGQLFCWGEGQHSPLLSAGPASSLTPSSAVLNGSIDLRNLDTEAWFEYWPAAASPQAATKTAIQQLAAGLSPVDLSTPVAGLSPDTDYLFRLAATNALGPEPVYSQTASMRTAAVPVVAVAAAATGLPPPVAGETVNIDTAGGTVKTKCEGEEGFTGLTGAKQVPVGCLIDANRGTVALTASKGHDDETESADFWGGLFRVTQEAGQDQDAVMTLSGKLRCEIRAATGSRAGQRSRRRGGGRKLWGSGEGNYKTVGSHGAATVRGTIWLVQDRCDGSTLFKVKSGTVWIRDFVKGTRVVLQEGEQYVIEPAIPRLSE
jgi:hypothetical protein